jgi:hypothetical protein
MTIRQRLLHKTTLAALGLTLAVATPALAQNSYRINVDLQSRPALRHVRGTRVYEANGQDRPNYDMFRYGRNYYVYQDQRWYRSRSWHGQFQGIDDRNVPAQFSRVRRGDWQDESWMDRHGRHRT